MTLLNTEPSIVSQVPSTANSTESSKLTINCSLSKTKSQSQTISEVVSNHWWIKNEWQFLLFQCQNVFFFVLLIVFLLFLHFPVEVELYYRFVSLIWVKRPLSWHELYLSWWWRVEVWEFGPVKPLRPDLAQPFPLPYSPAAGCALVLGLWWTLLCWEVCKEKCISLELIKWAQSCGCA